MMKMMMKRLSSAGLRAFAARSNATIALIKMPLKPDKCVADLRLIREAMPASPLEQHLPQLECGQHRVHYNFDGQDGWTFH
jgi:hypothetical protein